MSDTNSSHPLRNRWKVLERPATRKKVQALMLQGITDTEIGRQVGVSRQAISAFRKRHEVEIATVVAEVERQIDEFAIAHQVNRIADLDMLRGLALEELQANGYAWEEPTKYGSKRRVSGAVQELREADRQAAEELDQLPRGATGSQTAVIVNIIRDEPRLGV